ncbi:MAG: NAD(P)/FAD-dependent oxidoreductase, partial [Candidatus Methylomirabilota bacterium]
PASVLEEITRVTYEAKIIYYTRRFEDMVRTFCMCPYGEVIREDLGGLYTVNGHSYAHHKTANTNFALLVSKTFTEPFREPIAYGHHIARLANMLGGEVIVQRLGDLRQGRRSTPQRIERGLVEPTLRQATPGDLSLVLPYRYLANILEMLEALDRLVPGVNSIHTLLYGVEVKFYSLQLRLGPGLETEVANLFAVGDGAGVSRGLVQASASGVLAARSIAARIKGERG